MLLTTIIFEFHRICQVTPVINDDGSNSPLSQTIAKWNPLLFPFFTLNAHTSELERVDPSITEVGVKLFILSFFINIKYSFINSLFFLLLQTKCLRYMGSMDTNCWIALYTTPLLRPSPPLPQFLDVSPFMTLPPNASHQFIMTLILPHIGPPLILMQLLMKMPFPNLLILIMTVVTALNLVIHHQPNRGRLQFLQ